MKTKILAIALFMAVSLGVSATETADPAAVANKRAIELIERVQEIRTMDFSEFERGQKKEVKAELREIKKELRQIESTNGLDDRVSISIGAVIIILLLIIIL
ncbi:MAG: hypothetical protein GY816_12035 [Cytophagales bacterium]|nr:hypothetical protein [Cytophagales bacterium]